MFTLRSLIKRQSTQPFCVYCRLFSCRFLQIRTTFKSDSLLNKVRREKSIQTLKRIVWTQELTPKKRSPKTYPYPDQTKDYIPKTLVFVDNENQTAFKIIDSLLSQQKFEISKENPIVSANTQNILDQFLNIGPVNYQDNSYLITDLVQTMKSLSLQQICDVLESMTKWPVINSPFSKSFYVVWSNVDRELENRLKKVNFSDNNQVLPFLFVGNLFYRLKIANITKFNNLLVNKLSAPDFEPNKTTLVHQMFYTNLHRKVDPKSANLLLKHCESLVRNMSLDEIGVICMALFKTETKLTDELAKIVIFRTLTDISEETDNIIRCAIIKSLRRSANIRIRSQIQQFLNQIKKLSNNSELTLTHLMNLKVSAQIYDPELMTYVFDRLCSDPTAFRLKDIERIFLCLCFFDHNLDINKLEVVCNQLHEKSKTFQIYEYPICLLNILHYLSILGQFPKPLIEHCFEQNFLARIIKYSRLDFQRHLLVTNTALSVEKYEEFKEILLSPERVYRYYRWILTAEMSDKKRINNKAGLINSIYMTLKSQLHGRAQLCHIFPFKSYPLVILFDKQNRSFSLNPKTELKANMFDNCVAIHILDIQDFAIVDTMLKGSTRLQIRLLKKMGFKVVAIPWHQLSCFTTSKALRNKVIDEIKKIDPNFNF